MHFQMEFGVLMKWQMHADIEHELNQIAWGDINDHKINSDICLQWLIYFHNKSKRFFKSLENCERIVVLSKVVEQKDSKIGLHFTSEYKL